MMQVLQLSGILIIRASHCLFRLIADLPELLTSCDYVCSVLPSTAETDGLLDGDVLSHCKTKVGMNTTSIALIHEILIPH